MDIYLLASRPAVQSYLERVENVKVSTGVLLPVLVPVHSVSEADVHLPDGRQRRVVPVLLQEARYESLADLNMASWYS